MLMVDLEEMSLSFSASWSFSPFNHMKYSYSWIAHKELRISSVRKKKKTPI